MTRAIGPCVGVLGALVLGCGPTATGSAESTSSTDATETTTTTVSPETSASGPSGSGVETTAATVTTGGGETGAITSGTTSDGSSDETGAPTCPPILMCSGKVYDCGNGQDDDDDGLIDLDDPDCLSPCDDTEDRFEFGIPADNADPCRSDCFFDGNSGMGDDGCLQRFQCDPLGPLIDLGCDPDLPPFDCDAYPQAPMQCTDFCLPLTPNGCDCFGCCALPTDEGPAFFLLQTPGCSFDDLDACNPCTPAIEVCGNPCEPENCELCLGDTSLPDGCDEPTCDGGQLPCTSTCDCPEDHYCLTGCCRPTPS